MTSSLIVVTATGTSCSDSLVFRATTVTISISSSVDSANDTAGSAVAVAAKTATSVLGNICLPSTRFLRLRYFIFSPLLMLPIQ